MPQNSAGFIEDLTALINLQERIRTLVNVTVYTSGFPANPQFTDLIHVS